MLILSTKTIVLNALHVRAINMNKPLEQLDKSFINFVDHTQNKPSQIHKPYTQNRHKKLKGKI